MLERPSAGRPALLAPAVLALALPLAARQGAVSRPGDPRPYDVPVARFAATPERGQASLSVQFSDLTSGSVDAWSWDFGDGTTSTVRNPRHTYVEPGTYDVTLSVSGPSGKDSTTRVDLVEVDTLPPGFVDELVTKGFPQTTGFLVSAPDDLTLWTKAGQVWRWLDGSFLPEPLVDVTEEVGNWNDHGLHGFAYDPDYAFNGHVYLYYVVDRHHLDHFGTPLYDPNANEFNTATIGRVTRYTVLDPANPGTTVDPASRKVLVGEDAASGVPICASSHGIGFLAFGHDGSLLFSCGDASVGLALQPQCLADGILRPKEDVMAFRSQLVDSASGKLHRIDPATGDGHPTNPFYDPLAPRAWRSRTWALGLRQPYRFSLRPENEEHAGPGAIYVGDVGQDLWEELSVVTGPGQNFGWPFFEGFESHPYFYGQNEPNLDAPNPLSPQAGCGPFFLFEDLLVEDSLNPFSWPNPCDPFQEITSVPTFVHRRPAITWGQRDNSLLPEAFVGGYDAAGEAVALALDAPGAPIPGLPFFGNSSIGGTWYSGTTFPAPYRDVYFHGDFGEGWIKAFAFDEQDRLQAVHEFASGLGSFTFLATDPDHDALYYLTYGGGRIRRISFGGNASPRAVAEAAPSFGPGPLRVELSAGGSSDPEGAPMRFAWDFGAGELRTPLHELAHTVHVYGTEDTGSSAAPTRSPSEDPEPFPRVWSDGLHPPRGSTSAGAQAEIRGPDPWIGHAFPTPTAVAALIFQEGLDSGPRGGRLGEPVVEYRDRATGDWLPVEGLAIHPPYPSDPSLSYETFHLSFDPVLTDRVRLRDAAPVGGFTVAELHSSRVFRALPAAPAGAVGELGRPLSAAPATFVARVTATDDVGAQGSAAVLVSMNNTPPLVRIVSPPSEASYPVGLQSVVPLLATVDDAEHAAGPLACEWRIALVHENHQHPEPALPGCSGSFALTPHGELEGEVIYWRFELCVTDPEGLSTTVVHRLLPEGDCNLNGLPDALDIATGTAQDRNGNGVPDGCEPSEPFAFPGRAPAARAR